VCEPEPVTVRAAMLAVADLLRLPRPWLGVPAAPLLGGLRLAGADRLRRRLDLLAVEHTYHSERVWAASGLTPGTPMLERLPEFAAWYAACAGQGQR
jgi:hypothetical protein